MYILLQDLIVNILIYPSLYLTYQTKFHYTHASSNHNGTSAMLNNFEHCPICKLFQHLNVALNVSIRAKSINLHVICKYHIPPILNYLILVLFTKFQARTNVLESQQKLLVFTCASKPTTFNPLLTISILTLHSICSLLI